MTAPHMAPFNVALEQLIKQNINPSIEPHDRLVSGASVGALIFSAAGDSKPKVLILKRATLNKAGDLWEIPGGKVDPEDPTILSAVVREVAEETGLKIKDVVDTVDVRALDMPEAVAESRAAWDDRYAVDLQYSGPGQLLNAPTGELVVKLSFIATVDEPEKAPITLSPREHSTYEWATEDDLLDDETYKWTAEAQRKVVLRGFEMLK